MSTNRNPTLRAAVAALTALPPLLAGGDAFAQANDTRTAVQNLATLMKREGAVLPLKPTDIRPQTFGTSGLREKIKEAMKVSFPTQKICPKEGPCVDHAISWHQTLGDDDIGGGIVFDARELAPSTDESSCTASVAAVAHVLRKKPELLKIVGETRMNKKTNRATGSVAVFVRGQTQELWGTRGSMSVQKLRKTFATDDYNVEIEGLGKIRMTVGGNASATIAVDLNADRGVVRNNNVDAGVYCALGLTPRVASVANFWANAKLSPIELPVVGSLPVMELKARGRIEPVVLELPVTTALHLVENGSNTAAIMGFKAGLVTRLVHGKVTLDYKIGAGADLINQLIGAIPPEGNLATWKLDDTLGFSRNTTIVNETTPPLPVGSVLQRRDR